MHDDIITKHKQPDIVNGQHDMVVKHDSHDILWCHGYDMLWHNYWAYDIVTQLLSIWHCDMIFEHGTLS